jgi:AcrR family transcriptional regulator
MPRPGKGDRYHHGDLRAALTDTAIELIGERGVREFSLAEASRRLGVAVSAPYAHFADRDDLLAAVADDGPDQEPGVVELAAARTARAVLALIEGRRLLG